MYVYPLPLLQYCLETPYPFSLSLLESWRGEGSLQLKRSLMVLKSFDRTSTLLLILSSPYAGPIVTSISTAPTHYDILMTRHDVCSPCPLYQIVTYQLNQVRSELTCHRSCTWTWTPVWPARTTYFRSTPDGVVIDKKDATAPYGQWRADKDCQIIRYVLRKHGMKYTQAKVSIVTNE